MVKHVLKDGTVLNDITGHLVKRDDAPLAYAIIDMMNERIRKEGEVKGD